MARSPSDDRSDTMNPNNDAYWADQDNRFGSGDDDAMAWSERGESDGPVNGLRPGRGHWLDHFVDPALGPRTRYRHIDIADLRWEFEDAFKTAESERRDREAAIAEMLRLSNQILELARDVAIRQGHVAWVGASAGAVDLVFDDGSGFHVGRVTVAEEQPDSAALLRVEAHDVVSFGYVNRAWHTVSGERGPTCHATGDQSVLTCLIARIKGRRRAPGVEELRKTIRDGRGRPTPGEERDLAAAHARLTRILSVLPPGRHGSSPEDTWAPATQMR